MKNPKHLQLLINVAGAVVGLGVVGYVVYAALHTEIEKPCSERYPAAMRFSLQTSEGKPLSAIELQARAGLRDLGVIDNAAVVRTTGGPAEEALQVKLRPLPNGADAGAVVRNGIEFRWAPPGMENASAACLSYSVRIPDKFDFGGGGFLPGLFGSEGGRSAAREAFSVAPQWDERGRPWLNAGVEGGEALRVSDTATPLPSERWFRVEQEVVLNAPGQANGTARLWVNGELVAENLAVPLRKDGKALLAGVLAAIGYRRAPAQPGTVEVSAFDVSWR